MTNYTPNDSEGRVLAAHYSMDEAAAFEQRPFDYTEKQGVSDMAKVGLVLL